MRSISPTMDVRGALAVVAATVLTACSGGQPPADVADVTGPLEALPSCGPPPAAVADKLPTGLALPEDALLTGVTPRGPLTQVTAYLAMTPVQLRQYFEGRTDLQPIQIEDEIFEAEILVSDGTYRTFVKARALCSQGSDVVAIVAPETAAGELPAPAGSPAPVP